MNSTRSQDTGSTHKYQLYFYANNDHMDSKIMKQNYLQTKNVLYIETYKMMTEIKELNKRRTYLVPELEDST